MTNTFTNIGFIKFSELYNWSVGNLLGNLFTYNKEFPLVKIRMFLTKSNNQIVIQNELVYKRVTVKINNGGVIQRDTEKGNKIGTKRQFIVNSDQFIISKIDARNGAMGLIPKELDGAIVTNDFPTFNIDLNSILPQFLLLITTTTEFVEFAQSCSSGTTNRQRIDINKFLNVKIPLPPLNDEDAYKKNLPNTFTQEKLIESYNRNINKAKKLKFKAIEIEDEIETYILDELKINKSKKDDVSSGLNFYKFKDLERWDVWAFKSSSSSKTYSFLKFRDILLDKPVYGANVKGVKKKSETRYIRITDINEDGGLNDDLVYPEFVEEKFVLNENDFLIARSGNTVGKTFLYKPSFGRAIFAGYLIKFHLNLDMVIPEYVLAYTKSTIFKKWVNSNQRISGQPNINAQEYLEFPIIIPDKKTQKKIVTVISNIRNEIKSLLNHSEDLEQRAIKDFEKTIFKSE